MLSFSQSARDFTNTKMIFSHGFITFLVRPRPPRMTVPASRTSSDQRMWQQPVLYDYFLNDRILKPESKVEGTRTAKRNITAILRTLPSSFKGICPRPWSLLCLLMWAPHTHNYKLLAKRGTERQLLHTEQSISIPSWRLCRSAHSYPEHHNWLEPSRHSLEGSFLLTVPVILP